MNINYRHFFYLCLVANRSLALNILYIRLIAYETKRNINALNSECKRNKYYTSLLYFKTTILKVIATLLQRAVQYYNATKRRSHANMFCSVQKATPVPINFHPIAGHFSQNGKTVLRPLFCF